MGTSKSQPSPTGRSGSGKAWQDAIDSLAVGTSATITFDLIIRANQKEYDQQALGILADKGVLASVRKQVDLGTRLQRQVLGSWSRRLASPVVVSGGLLFLRIIMESFLR